MFNYFSLNARVFTVRPLLGTVLLLIGNTANAALISLNFEDLPAVDLLAGTPVEADSQLHNQFLTSYGVSFSSGTESNYAAIVHLGPGATSGVNGVGSVDNSGLVRYTSPLEISFFDPNNSTILATTDFISIRGDFDATNPGTFILMTAFDRYGNEIGSQYSLDAGGTTLSLSMAGMHSVVLTQTIQSADNVAFDDLVFNMPVAVPEVSTFALMSGVMLGIAGFVSRRFRASRLSRLLCGD